MFTCIYAIVQSNYEMTQNKLQQKRIWCHFNGKILLNNILKVYKNRRSGTMPNLHKFKMAATITRFDHISGSTTSRNLFFVSIPTF